VLILLILFM